MPQRRAAWRAILLSHPCPTCGADPGLDCRTSGGKKAETPHADRGRFGERCPTCRALLPGGSDPGDLCGRCTMVRALELERVTKWVRRDP